MGGGVGSITFNRICIETPANFLRSPAVTGQVVKRSTERYIRVFPSHAFLLNGRAWLVIGHKAGINPEVQSVAIVLLIELQRKQPASSLQLCQSPHSFSACAYDNVDFWKSPEKILFESAVLFLTVEDGVIIHFHQIIGFFCYFCEPPDLPLNPVIWPWVLFV